MTATLPRRLFMTSGPSWSGSIALTFDDGPHPTYTPAVLQRLRELRVRATFFVVGAKAEAHPELVARIAAEGHELGHHSYRHGAPHETSALTAAAEARRTSVLLRRLVGKAPSLYRPPHGKLTPGKLAALWAMRQTVVLWNRDPKDFACGDAEPIRHWFETTPLAPGDIVLLHDVHAHIAPALGAVVERARRLGLGFCTPAEWCHG
jgi:peptidoglycan/xylan/chitin deacetylase (PgdA/CDA1 family)